MKVTAHTIEEFFAAAGEREGDLRALDALICEHAPSAERSLFKSTTMTMLSYGMYHYKYASGREGDWPVIALANQKNHISLYISAFKNSQYLAEVYGKKLGKVSTGKSCIRFKKMTDLDLVETKKILAEAAEWYERHRNITVTPENQK